RARHAAAVPARRSRARPRAAALHPGDHHQRRAPCPGGRAAPELPLRRPHGDAPGARQWARRRAAGGRQRPARHPRAAGGVRRPGGDPHPAGRGLRDRHRVAAGRRAETASGSNRMIRICLVDDQTLVRQGIRSLLSLAEGIEVVAEAADGKQAVEMIPGLKPDVVLMDMRMPVMSGLEALQALARLDALPPTIILTTFDDDQLVLAGLKAGAKGYLLKDVSLEQLVGAIQAVAAGGSLVQPAVTQRLLSGLEHMRNEFVSLDRPDPLTDRETEILRL